MKRREFLEKAGCGAAGLAAAPLSGVSGQSKEPMVIRRFDLEGVTTEYIRCPDPSKAGIVVKITRTFKDKRTFQG
jgi:hypothetical protein